MPEIQTPDPGRKVQIRYSLTGPSTLPSLSPELVGVVLVDDLRRFSVRDATFERPCFLAHPPTLAGAGNMPRISFSNPANSGILAHVQGASFSPSAINSIIRMEFFVGALGTTTGTKRFRDGRMIQGLPVCGTFEDTPVLAVKVGMGWIVTGSGLNPGEVAPLDEVLSPGTGLVFTLESANSSLELHLWWTERFILPGE